jgi:hypothetical protein
MAIVATSTFVWLFVRVFPVAMVSCAWASSSVTMVIRLMMMVAHVTIITLLHTLPNITITATHNHTIIQADIIIANVTIVALLDTLTLITIAAAHNHAVIETNIIIAHVTIVALLDPVLHTITTIETHTGTDHVTITVLTVVATQVTNLTKLRDTITTDTNDHIFINTHIILDTIETITIDKPHHIVTIINKHTHHHTNIDTDARALKLEIDGICGDGIT